MKASSPRDRALSVLARQLAGRDIAKTQVEGLADFVLNGGVRPLKLYPCSHGICIDYGFRKWDDLNVKDLVSIQPGIVRNVDILIDGIIDPDAIRVTIGQEMV